MLTLRLRAHAEEAALDHAGHVAKVGTEIEVLERLVVRMLVCVDAGQRELVRDRGHAAHHVRCGGGGDWLKRMRVRFSWYGC